MLYRKRAKRYVQLDLRGGVHLDFPFPLRQTWVEVDLGRIIHNVKEFRQLLGPRVQIMAVVKADGYGHGAVPVARAAITAGASSLAVAMPDEGIELRRAGIEAPILLLGYTDPDHAPLLNEYRLTPTIYDLETARSLGRWFAERQAEVPVHVKVDTGMGRVGAHPKEAVHLIAAVAGLPGLQLAGVLTHLAAADEAERTFTDKQLHLFDEVLAACRARGLDIPIRHAANSAAAAVYPDSRYNLIRLGISMYGCHPSLEMDRSPVRLLPALAFKSKIIFLKEVPPDTPISYGCTYRTAERAFIATVPAGYADGYNRRLSNRGRVLVRGCRAPVVGRVCMDQFMIDVTGVPDVSRGDEVVIYGRQGGAEVTVDEVAAELGTINYELLCTVGKRVPRLYLREGRAVAARDLLGEKYFT